MNTRFDTEARIAVTQAADIARELGHREVGPDHLLLGLLANPRGTAYAALTDHGITLDAARELVAERHVDPVDETAPGDEPAASAYDDDREALRAIGIDLDRVRDAVRANLGQDLGDGWGDRPERGPRGRGRGRERRGGGRHHHHHERAERAARGDDDRDERSDAERERGRGRRGPRSRRPFGPAFSRSLRSLLHDVRRSVLRDRLADDRSERDARQGVTGMTGARLLVALTRSDDEVVQAVLATADGLDALRAQAEAATRPTTV